MIPLSEGAFRSLRAIGFPRASIESHVATFSAFFRSSSGLRHRPPNLARPPLPIVFTSRVGSEFLSSCLLQTGAFGRLGEYLNAHQLEMMSKAESVPDLAAWLEHLAAAVGSPEGRFGWKGPVHQVITLAMFDMFPAAFEWPWIFLRRDDLVGQSVSLAIAEQTGAWTSLGEATGAAAYDRDGTARAMRAITRSNAMIEAFFAASGVKPLRLTYEGVAADPQAAVDAVLRHAGLAAGARVDPARSAVSVQRTALNEEMRRRFVADFRDGFA